MKKDEESDTPSDRRTKQGLRLSAEALRQVTTKYPDMARYVFAYSFIKDAVNSDSTGGIISSSIIAACLLSPNLVHLALKNRLVARGGRALLRRTIECSRPEGKIINR